MTSHPSTGQSRSAYSHSSRLASPSPYGPSSPHFWAISHHLHHASRGLHSDSCCYAPCGMTSRSYHSCNHRCCHHLCPSCDPFYPRGSAIWIWSCCDGEAGGTFSQKVVVVQATGMSIGGKNEGVKKMVQVDIIVVID